jgi:spore coat polysaccharide biosynthesis predicted glycosyltransferase SpsG
MESNQEVKNIFFKVNFNNNLGLGNLLRCIRIAKEFPNKKKIFVIQSILNEKIKKHLPKKCKIIISKDKNLSLEKAAKKFLLIPELCSQSIVIVDDNRINKIWHKIIINRIKKLIVIDDLALNQNFCDLYINYKFTTKFNHLSKIKKLNKKKTKIFLGKEFIIIDKNLKKIKRKNKYAKKVLINFGNSFDFYRAKNLIREIMAITPKKTNILVCIGILARNYKYKINLKKTHSNLKIVYKKIFIEKILTYVDIFIGSCGSSLYENGYLNVPSIFFSISLDQINKIQDVKIGRAHV